MSTPRMWDLFPGSDVLFGLPFLIIASIKLRRASSPDHVLISKTIQGPTSHLGKQELIKIKIGGATPKGPNKHQVVGQIRKTMPSRQRPDCTSQSHQPGRNRKVSVTLFALTLNAGRVTLWGVVIRFLQSVGKDGY